MTYNFYIISTFIFISIMPNSCGIYSFSGTSIPENAKTVSVEYITNEADLVEPNLSNRLTEKLIDKFQQESHLITKNNNADIKFSGKIIKYEITPISIQTNETAAQNRLTISLEIHYTNTLNNSENFKKTFVDYADFNSTDIFSEIEETLNEIITENLIDDIFNAAFMNW